MNDYPVGSTSQKPGMFTAIAIMTLVNGILNIMWGLGLTSGVVLGTLFVGLLCAPITLLPAVLGIFEVIYAAKLMSNPPQPVQSSQTIAILEIAAVISGNILSAIVGILALIFYNDPIVKNYFAWLNGQPVPVSQPVQTAQPALTAQADAPTAETQPEKLKGVEPAVTETSEPSSEKPMGSQTARKSSSSSSEEPKKPAGFASEKSGNSSS
jgi:hypothetical protein